MPASRKRLLSDTVVQWCAQSGRYTFIKDTCCQIDTIKRRIALIKDSQLHIANANGQTLLASLQAGAHGCKRHHDQFSPGTLRVAVRQLAPGTGKGRIVSDYLSTASLVECLDYPICAKDYRVSIGNFASVASRTREAGNYYSAHFQSNMQQMIRLGETLKKQLSI